MRNDVSAGIPATYDGREQALVKHRLLEDYLEKLFLIIGMASKSGSTSQLCYVDCFAGPWGDASTEMQSTSIAISLKTLDTCRQKLASLGVFVKIKALYIEENKAAFARLQKYLSSSTPRGVQSACLQGDFVDLRQSILEWVGPQAFAFFFIDPKGYTEIGVPILQPLLARPRSEFLINLMYDHPNRAMSMEDMRPAMVKLIGHELDLAGQTPRQRERTIVLAYREGLKASMPDSLSHPPRAAHVRVMNPERDRPKYHLVYATSHPKGVVKFMQISEGVDIVQSHVRAVKRDTKRAKDMGMEELWPAGSMVEVNAPHSDDDEIDGFWSDYLAGTGRTIDTAAFADILERTEWFERDLQSSLVRLIKAGRVVNRTADASRRYKRPLHYEDGQTTTKAEKQGNVTDSYRQINNLADDVRHRPTPIDPFRPHFC